MLWVKIHTRKLDDIRFAKITLAQMGRWTQLMMLSGRLDGSGGFYQNCVQLSEPEIAYLLRANIDDLRADLASLKSAGLARLNGHGWELLDFSDEQGPSDAEQRSAWQKRQQRHRNKSVTRDKPVTHAPRTRPEPESDIEPEEEPEKETDESPSTNQLTSGGSANDHPTLVGDGDLESAIVSLTRTQKDTARTAYKILGASGLGNPKLLETTVLVAMRIELKNVREYILAALSGAYADGRALNKPVIAAHRIAKGNVDTARMKPEAWTEIPKNVLAAAGIDDDYNGKRYAVEGTIS
jgi:hypothetical protein